MTQYGPIFEFWYDGANGEGPNGKKQIYDWPLFNGTVNEFMPNAIQFSDNGPDIRWVGNEKGYAYDETWSNFNKNEIYPGYLKFDDYKNGQENGSHWVPVEVDVSIRPGWYYHPNQDNQVKSADSLMKIYVSSVGRNGNLLLNIPVDNRGLIHPNDSASLLSFANIRSKSLKNLLASSNYIKKGNANPNLEIKVNKPVLANTLMLQEPIAFGQRVAQFQVIVEDLNGIKENFSLKTIGNKRMITFKERFVKNIQIIVQKARAKVIISNIELYRIISTHNESLFH